MPTQVIVTKLFAPPPRPSAVSRPRLIARLDEGLHRKLTLVAAPAGFGKTTLVASWLAERMKDEGRGMKAGQPDPSSFIPLPSSFAWLSLDEADNDPARFLAYLVAALQTIVPTIGVGVVAVLQSPQLPPPDVILTALLNEITALPNHVVLVLDDYHVINAAPVDSALVFLVEHLPPHLHLVIVTREDPPLPLARLRARGQLTELRAADLRFTPAEAAAFLHEVMGLTLSAADIATLEARTEGWIAGLQLAALSMQGHRDVPGFIRAFAGDHRYIVDYLIDEVLQRQPAPLRSFLLQTAILDRLSGPLCDAVTGQEGGSAQLEALERGNFFVAPLDDQRHWYRYHQLFADVLAAHLRAEQPDLVSTLHRRASAWYAQHGAPADAIRHALAAEDFARAADLVELAVPALLRSRQEARLLGWLQALPNEVLHVRPVLSVGYAHTLLSRGELDGVEALLRDAERWLDTPANIVDAQPDAQSAAMVVVDEEAFRRLPSTIAVARAGLALARGDLVETVAYASRVRDLVPADDHLGRGAATAILGLAYWTSGDLAAAHRAYAEGMAHLQLAGNIADAIGGAITLADIRIAQGRLAEALRTYARGMQLATAQGMPTLRGTADMYVGMSAISREQNDLPAAMQHLRRSQEQGEHTGFPQHPYRWRVAMAGIREAQGDLEGALDLLDEAERRYVSDFLPNVRPITARKARVWVTQGRLGEALGWARDQGLSVDDEISYLREFEHITLARLLLARAIDDRADSAISEAVGLLGRLLHAAEAGERTGSVIEILLLLSLAQQARGDTPAALVPLSRALALAEPEGYVRLFVDEGPPMAALLGRMKDEGGKMKEYVARLLAAFGTQEAVHPSSFIPHPLIEPLSQRELALLRLLKTELSGPEIARELVIALSTVRTYTKSIYSKLNVNTRRAAVKRAEALGLI
ncbi:MAG: LuxR C-terminal-related transcriptional regulator [Chloroflexales bacterium]